MGFAPSSANAVRHLGLAQEIAVGDHLHHLNPFHWTRVVLNLPGSQDFDPSMPWVYKFNPIAKRIARDFITFVDDVRVTGFSIENCWQCGRRLASVLQHLGIQDASRKRKPPSLTPGAWAGCVARSNRKIVYRTVTLAKWNKGKEYLALVIQRIDTRCNPLPVQLKLLEKARGYFNHLCIVYDFMLPYLKGFHNSIDG